MDIPEIRKVVDTFKGPFENTAENIIRQHVQNNTDKLIILRVYWVGSLFYELNSSITRNMLESGSLPCSSNISLVIKDDSEAEFIAEYILLER